MEMSEEQFTKSECPCEWCRETHSEAKKWDTYVATNNLQQRGLDVVRKLEEQVELRHKIEKSYSREAIFFDLLGD